MNPSLPRALRDLYVQHRAALTPIWDPSQGLTVDIKVPARITLTPERTRCRACRGGLGDLVVVQMYCSYRCAGLPEPVRDVAAAPRVCKRAARTDERGEWAFKQRFAVPAEAQRYLKPGTVLYRCSNCFFLHIGNVSAPPRTGLPPAPTGNGPFGDCVAAVLRARGDSEDSPAAVAAAKRDVRAVFEVLGVPTTQGGLATTRRPAAGRR